MPAEKGNSQQKLLAKW